MGRLIFPGLVACALMAPVAARAQAVTGAIRGEVSAAGEPVPRAEIVIVHGPSGTRARTRADARGAFSMTGLRTGGPYVVTVTTPDFEDYSVGDITLVAGRPLRLPIRLAAQQEMLVTADRLRIASLSAGPASVYGPAEISGIASVRRDLRDVVRRDPLVAIDPAGAGAIDVGGLDGRLNRFSVEGVRFAGALPSAHGPVSLDAIGQIAVKGAPFDVAEGDVRGGAIDLVLRSGSNTATGAAFISYNGDRLTGGMEHGRFDSHDYGGFLAGAIVKDRLFFALSYERLDEAGDVATDLADPVSLRRIEGHDEKYSAKLDWNIAPGQRAAVSYIHNDGAARARAGDWRRNDTLDAVAVQLNSDWSARFSTQARFTHSRIAREGSAGAIGLPAICPDPAAPCRAESTGGEWLANLQIGAHAFKAVLGYDRMVQAAGADAPSLSRYSFALQDSWNAGETLNLAYGARFDALGGGPSAVQPRMSAVWQPKRRITLRGGIGLFAQMVPDGAIAGAMPALDPDDRLPSLWKSSLSFDYLMDLGPFGDGWRFGADLLYAAPKGAPGHAFTAVARVGTEFDFGLAANIAYVRQYAKDRDSVAGYGRSAHEIRSTLKFAFDYAYAFVDDHKTRFSLFGEWRSGRPYSLVMQEADLMDAPLMFVRDHAGPNTFRVDLHVDQDVPTPLAKGTRLKLFADVENVLNLIDRDWGGSEPASVSPLDSDWGVRLGARVEF